MRLYEEGEEIPTESPVNDDEIIQDSTEDIPTTTESPSIGNSGEITVFDVDITPIVETLELIRENQAIQYLHLDDVYKRDREISYAIMTILALIVLFQIASRVLGGHR